MIQGTLGKDLLTTSHPDCDRGKVESPVVPGSGQVGVQPEKKGWRGKIMAPSWGSGEPSGLAFHSTAPTQSDELDPAG